MKHAKAFREARAGTFGVGIDLAQFAEFVVRDDRHLFPVLCVLPLLQLHVHLDVLDQVLQVGDR